MSKKRWDKHQEATRLAFLNAGLQLILEKGYDNVTVSDIARLADYGRSTFYIYFKDKEALFWDMIHHHAVVLDEQIQDAVSHLQSPKREWRAWLMIFTDIDKQREVFIKLDGEMSRRLRQMQKDYVTDVFERQLKNNEFSLMIDVPHEITARFIVGGQIEILDYWLTHPEIGNAETIAGYFYRLVFREDPPT